jgi:hypothetical protein
MHLGATIITMFSKHYLSYICKHHFYKSGFFYFHRCEDLGTSFHEDTVQHTALLNDKLCSETHGAVFTSSSGASDVH